jgi:glycosyltransferase involved in cell wall biosynthesis
VTLARTLIARGHDVMLVPLYTPLITDGPDPSERRIFYGGLGAYLAQKSALFRRRLPLVDRVLDSRLLLGLVSRLAVSTRPEELGEMTVSVLQGPRGRQAKDLDELIDFLHRGPRPDVVNLTNSLLAAIAPELKRRLGVTVACTLQGEESFLSRLPAEHGAEAWRLLREHARAIDVFLAPSDDYADEMATEFGERRERFRTVRPGVDTEIFRPAEIAAEAAPSDQGGDELRPLRVGCVSRLAPEKGSDLLGRAMVEIARRRPGRVTLTLAGQVGPGEGAWWRGVRETLDAAALPEGTVRIVGAIGLEDKLTLLRGLDVFAQPSRQPERRGMASLEALACGVPIVVPRSGIFPELVGRTGGGVLVERESVAGLVDAVLRLADDPAERRRMAMSARQGVVEHYSASRLADEALAVYEELVGG